MILCVARDVFFAVTLLYGCDFGGQLSNSCVSLSCLSARRR